MHTHTFISIPISIFEQYTPNNKNYLKMLSSLVFCTLKKYFRSAFSLYIDMYYFYNQETIMTSSLYSNWGKGLKQVANSILNIFLLQAESIETQVVLNLQKEASIMKRWQAQDRSRGNKHRKISQFYCCYWNWTLT